MLDTELSIEQRRLESFCDQFESRTGLTINVYGDHDNILSLSQKRLKAHQHWLAAHYPDLTIGINGNHDDIDHQLSEDGYDTASGIVAGLRKMGDIKQVADRILQAAPVVARKHYLSMVPDDTKGLGFALSDRHPIGRWLQETAAGGVSLHRQIAGTQAPKAYRLYADLIKEYSPSELIIALAFNTTGGIQLPHFKPYPAKYLHQFCVDLIEGARLIDATSATRLRENHPPENDGRLSKPVSPMVPPFQTRLLSNRKDAPNICGFAVFDSK